MCGGGCGLVVWVGCGRIEVVELSTIYRRRRRTEVGRFVFNFFHSANQKAQQALVTGLVISHTEKKCLASPLRILQQARRVRLRGGGRGPSRAGSRPNACRVLQRRCPHREMPTHAFQWCEPPAPVTPPLPSKSTYASSISVIESSHWTVCVESLHPLKAYLSHGLYVEPSTPSEDTSKDLYCYPARR